MPPFETHGRMAPLGSQRKDVFSRTLLISFHSKRPSSLQLHSKVIIFYLGQLSLDWHSHINSFFSAQFGMTKTFITSIMLHVSLSFYSSSYFNFWTDNIVTGLNNLKSISWHTENYLSHPSLPVSLFPSHQATLLFPLRFLPGRGRHGRAHRAPFSHPTSHNKY